MTNSIGMKLVLIPPGEFEMGSAEDTIARELREHEGDPWYVGFVHEEGPRHRVRLSRPFGLAMYLTTQEEYRKIVGVNPSAFTPNPLGPVAFSPPLNGDRQEERTQCARRVSNQQTNRYPVDYVSWNDAVVFCRKLSDLPEERAAQRVYRLPTEAEWEYACCAGITSDWLCGDSEAGLEQYAWFSGNAHETTHPVGERAPNAWGLYDMTGNLGQCCADWYSAAYYKESPLLDPRGPAIGTKRANRGGSWFHGAEYSRPARRGSDEPSRRLIIVGFRVALDLASVPSKTPQ